MAFTVFPDEIFKAPRSENGYGEKTSRYSRSGDRGHLAGGPLDGAHGGL